MKKIYLLAIVLLIFTKGNTQTESDSKIIPPATDILAEPPSKPEKFDIRIFPNPTFENLHVESTEDILTKILFWDVHGRLVYEEIWEAPQKEVELSLHDLPKGIYFLEAHLNDGNSVREKIVTQ